MGRLGKTLRWGAFHRRILVTVVVATVFSGAPLAWGSNWIPTLHTGSSGEAKSTAAPGAPTGVSATCTSSSAKTVKVAWSAVTHATSYTVSQSSTSATSGYSVVATGVTARNWTTGSLSTGKYWYAVAATVGTHWASVHSSGVGSRTIADVTPLCN